MLKGWVGEEKGFDPLGVTDALPVYWVREAELKHGRVCMLATVPWALVNSVLAGFLVFFFSWKIICFTLDCFLLLPFLVCRRWWGSVTFFFGEATYWFISEWCPKPPLHSSQTASFFGPRLAGSPVTWASASQGISSKPWPIALRHTTRWWRPLSLGSLMVR